MFAVFPREQSVKNILSGRQLLGFRTLWALGGNQVHRSFHPRPSWLISVMTGMPGKGTRLKGDQSLSLPWDEGRPGSLDRTVREDL